MTAQSTSTGAQSAQQAARELSQMASELQQLVGKFIVEEVASSPVVASRPRLVRAA